MKIMGEIMGGDFQSPHDSIPQTPYWIMPV